MNEIFNRTEYIVEQKLVSLRDTFALKTRDGQLLAYIKHRIVSIGPQFWWEALDGTHVGEVHGKVLAVRPTFEIYNEQGQQIATLRKKILKFLGSEWWLCDNNDTEIARIKGNITTHDYEVQDAVGTILARVHKKWVSVRDSYCVEIVTNQTDKGVLPTYYILSFIIAMDTVEYKKRATIGGFIKV